MTLKWLRIIPLILVLGCETFPVDRELTEESPVTQQKDTCSSTSGFIEPLSEEELLLYPLTSIGTVPKAKKTMTSTPRKALAPKPEVKSAPETPSLVKPQVLTESQVDFLNGDENNNSEEESDQKEFIRHFR